MEKKYADSQERDRVQSDINKKMVVAEKVSQRAKAKEAGTFCNNMFNLVYILTILAFHKTSFNQFTEKTFLLFFFFK